MNYLDVSEPREVQVSRLRVVVRELRADLHHHQAQRKLHERAVEISLKALQNALSQCLFLNMNTQEIWGEEEKAKLK